VSSVDSHYVYVELVTRFTISYLLIFVFLALHYVSFLVIVCLFLMFLSSYILFMSPFAVEVKTLICSVYKILFVFLCLVPRCRPLPQSFLMMS
jgi:hypothetical protein